MTISLSPETEAKLRERARLEARDVNALAEALLSTALGESDPREFGIKLYQRRLSDSDAKTLLEQECAKLNREEEHALAEEGMTADSAAWPQY